MVALKGVIMNAGRPANTPEVLWSKVDKKGLDECWEWKGTKNTGGYGRTQINGMSYYAHRVIFNLANPNTITLAGPKNRKAFGFLMHTCDNPPCCNPKHLIVADQKANMKDRKEKNRANLRIGTNHQRAVFTKEEETEILRLRKEFGYTIKELSTKFGKNLSTMKTMIRRNKEVING